MSKWSQDIHKLAEKTKLDLETVVKKVTFDIFNSIIQKSPVGNPDLWKYPAQPGYVGGRFRANWNVSAAQPDFTTTESTADRTAEASKALTFDVGGVVYISNGLPYAKHLEYGYSTQAPYGMVRHTLLEYRRYLLRALY